MKLRNKKTGEIVKIVGLSYHHDRLFYELEDENGTFKKEIDSLAELNEDWEDYEEPKDHYYIDYDGDIMIVEELDYEPKIKEMKQIGNYFETKEESERVVEKLKAWKRLKDKGFFFDGWSPIHDNTTRIRARIGLDPSGEMANDLDLLFGGKE